MIETKELTVNIGPQHPATHGVFRAEIDLDGEFVKAVRPHIGYLHRSIEKMAEKRTYAQFVPVTDRLDYLGSPLNNLAYCMTVEKLAGIDVPERAQYLRVIASEFGRIASHLVAIGTTGLDTGALTLFFYCFRERELVLSIFEKLCGARLTYNYLRIGGVSGDLPEGLAEEMLDFCNIFPEKVDEYNRLFFGSRMLKQRAQGVGYMSKEDALAYGTSGPILRSSGVDFDLRKDDPYLVYDRFDFNVPVGSGGDAYDRTVLRVEEMLESVSIIRQALEQMPDGPVMARNVPRLLTPPAGEAYGRVESPRGELGFHIVSDGSPFPYRLKVRGPAFSNLSSIETMGLDCLISDFVVIIGTLDPVFGEVDR